MYMEKSMKHISSKQVLEISVIFFWASEYCHAPYFTPYLESLHISATVIGLIVGCYGLTQMLIRIPMGVLTDATGRYKTVIVSGLFFTTLSSFGLWLFDDIRLIFFFRMLAGVAAATWIATTVAYMSFYKTEDGVKATAVLNGLNSSGKLFAFVIGSLAARFINYRATLFLSFAVGMIGFIIVLFMEPIRMVCTPISMKNFIRCIKNKHTIIPAILASVNMMIMHGTVYSFTSTLAVQVGAGAFMLSALSIIFTLVQIFSVGFLKSDKVKNANFSTLLSVGFLLSSGYLVLLGFATNVYWILIGQVLVGIANALSNSLLMNECVRGVSPGEKTIAMGIYQAIFSIGMTIGPMYMGGAIETLGSKNGCCLMAALVAVVALLVRLFLFKTHGEQPA